MRHSIGLRLFYKKDNDILFINSPEREKEVDLDGCTLEKVEMQLPVHVNRLTESFMKELFLLLQDKDIEYVDNISRQLQIICSRTIWQEYFIDNCNKYNYKELDWIIKETVDCFDKGGN